MFAFVSCSTNDITGIVFYFDVARATKDRINSLGKKWFECRNTRELSGRNTQNKYGEARWQCIATNIAGKKL